MTHRNHLLLARLSLAMSQLLVGTTVVAARFMVEAFPIALGLAIRQSVASLALLLIVLVVDRRLPHVPRRDHVLTALQALTGVVLFNSLLLAGVDRTTAITAGVITSTIPAAIALLSRLLGERISRPTAFGIALAIGGVMMVNLSGSAESESSASAPVLGGFLVILAVICEAFFTILGKAVSRQTSILQNCLLVCLYGTVMFLPMAAWQAAGWDPRTVPTAGWLALLWSAGPVMIGGFFLWFAGLRVIPANAAAVYTGLIPVSAVLTSWAVLGESIGPLQMMGLMLVLAAILLVTRGNRSLSPP